MPTPHKHAALIKLWADGAEIEYLDCGVDWEPVGRVGPIWDAAIEYRVKPTPKPNTVTWHRLWASGEIANSYPHQPTTTNPHCQALLRIEIDHNDHNDPAKPVLVSATLEAK